MILDYMRLSKILIVYTYVTIILYSATTLSVPFDSWQLEPSRKRYRTTSGADTAFGGNSGSCREQYFLSQMARNSS